MCIRDRQYRTLTKLNSTYVEGLKPLIGKDGKIRAHLQQTVTATGRISCTEPNLQKMCIRDRIGDVGILIVGQKLDFWNLTEAASIKQSLGIGMMVGTGVGILVKGILPKAKEIFGGMFSKDRIGDSIIAM